ncbi:transposase [Listeria seeligeri]|nr:transposase [Listeria ivanovii]MBM5636063.1 transposase [Listeria ivanovii]MBM5705246.1 transposase [Listeria ivanovii]MBM5721624.1 transposase [Listeria ivanovii]QDA76141.1 transposase [Listeria seeligeri]
MPKSSYYRWKKNTSRKEVSLVEFIQSICIKHKFRYGYRRVTAELRWKYDQTINHKKV